MGFLRLPRRRGRGIQLGATAAAGVAESLGGLPAGRGTGGRESVARGAARATFDLLDAPCTGVHSPACPPPPGRSGRGAPSAVHASIPHRPRAPSAEPPRPPPSRSATTNGARRPLRI